MCGISGIWSNGRSRQAMESIIGRMNERQYHRGPDASGCWISPDTGMALGHRRLAVLDVSINGHQPMISRSKRYVIVYNGEVYNHGALRCELEKATGSGIAWRGHTDTEIILEAIEFWGLKTALQKFVGMFAFALWDCQTGALYLVRDRLGEKPLYYGFIGEDLVFASELKALKVHPDWRGELDRSAIAQFMRYAYVPTPFSVYEGIRKLEPGCYLTIKGRDLQQRRMVEPQSYWRLRDVAQSSTSITDIGEAKTQLSHLLRDAVRSQLIADVPVGIFLSGGIDSSLVASMMQAEASEPIKTFTIGFNEVDYDEAKYAKVVAQTLGTDHTEIYLNGRDALDVVPSLAGMYDEPFADSSQIPTYLVARLAREKITVALSGDGGDELFGGYNRYLWVETIWRRLGYFPLGLRRALASGMKNIPPKIYNGLGLAADFLMPGKYGLGNLSDKAYKISDIIGLRDRGHIYRALVAQWREERSVVLGAKNQYPRLDAEMGAPLPGSFQQFMMYLDAMTYLPDDILTKVDRAAMSVSLETRLPLLDSRVVEFAFSLPLSLKINNGITKRILRELLADYIPRKLFERPKMGFSIPVGAWLRHDLRDWAEHLLDERRLREQGLLNVAIVRSAWSEHLAGTRNWQHFLWNVLMLQDWFDHDAVE